MIKLLDCTLRDGAHVNQGKFDESDVAKVLKVLSNDIVDYVEIGLLEPNHPIDAISFFSNVGAVDDVIQRYGSREQSYGILLRTDRCPIDLITRSDYINFVRIAMYPEQVSEVRKYVKKLHSFGYKVAINPIGISVLSEIEILSCADLANEIGVATFSIVDTHGALTNSALIELLRLLDVKLNSSMSIGLHLHENMNQCQSLVRAAVNTDISDRELIIDASLNGMGRVPGNLPLELLLNQLNDLNVRKTSPMDLYEIIGDLRNKYFKSNPWGYNLIYGESARLNINRSYPEFFEKSGLPFMSIIKCMSLLENSSYSARFNKNIAEKILRGNFVA